MQDSAAGSASRGWRTTDEEEISKRRRRAETEAMQIVNLDPRHPIFSNFEAAGASGRVYRVEIRDLKEHHASCSCVDFRTNSLGTCKHIEAVLIWLRSHHQLLFGVSETAGSQRIDIAPDRGSSSLRVERNLSALPLRIRTLFNSEGRLAHFSPEEAFEMLAQTGIPNVRISQDLQPWIEERKRLSERKQLRRDYESRVQQGEWPAFETTRPLLPFQREGMLHLAFTERAILADEIGLGKSVEAIAASALLHRLQKATRVLVVTPGSLLEEWETQIRKFTQLGQGRAPESTVGLRKLKENAPFFLLQSHENLGATARELSENLKPEILILDDAQRLRNWNTPVAQAFKYFNARYVFVLTGSPIFEQLERLFLLMDLVDPAVLGPLFRFNRDFYELDEDGRPKSPRNLDQLRNRVEPFILRRRKSGVEHELPEINERIYHIDPSSEQHSLLAAASISAREALETAIETPALREEATLLVDQTRRLANGVGMVHPDLHESTKLRELEFILEECRDNREFRTVIFTEWEESGARIAELASRLGLESAPLPKRFKRRERSGARLFIGIGDPPETKVLDAIHVVIHFDFPLKSDLVERRLAAVWKSGGPHLLTSIFLVCKHSIEARLVEEFRETPELPSLWAEGDFGSMAGRVLNLLPRTSAENTPPTPPVSPAQTPKVVEIACAVFGENAAVIEETGNPFDAAKRRVLIVLNEIPANLDMKGFEKEIGQPIVVIDFKTYSAGKELVSKEILPPPMFPPRVLFSRKSS